MMKHKGSKLIRKPRETVISCFLDTSSIGKYQDGFVSKELIKGIENEHGAESKIVYQLGKREMVLTETVTKNDLPNSYEAFYHHEHMDNTMKYQFIEVDANTTRFEYEYEYTRINWILPKLMAILFPSIYRKQGEKWMSQFKDFVEQQ